MQEKISKVNQKKLPVSKKVIKKTAFKLHNVLEQRVRLQTVV